MTPPPSDLIWEKFQIGKILNFWNNPSEKNVSLKHLKLPKNHFQTNIFFCSTETFKVFIYNWDKPEIVDSPPPLVKKSTFWIVHFFSQSFSLTQYVVLTVRLSACLPACLPVRPFQLASWEVLLTILMSNIVGEYRRVFYNYPGPKNKQCHTQMF